MFKKSIFRHFFSAFIFLMLLAGFSGCNDLTRATSKPSDDGKAYIRVDVASVSRTALPHFVGENSISDFQFTITGKGPESSDLEPLVTEENTTGVYDSLTALEQAAFPVVMGVWSFNLTAQKDGTVLSSAVSIEITDTTSTLYFDLQWDNTAISGTGSLSFEFDYNEAPNKNLVDHVTGQLYSYSVSTGESTEINDDEYKEKNLDISSSKVTYSLADVAAGNYKIMIRLYDDEGNLLMRYPEMAIITGGQVSSSSKSVSMLESVYTITYVYNRTGYELDAAFTLLEKYTRFTFENPYYLPNADDLTCQGYTFVEWYEDAALTLPVYSISAAKSGDLTFYAKWAPNTNTRYTIKHWKQKLDALSTEHSETNYSLDPEDEEICTGTTDAYVVPVAQAFDGFTAPEQDDLDSLRTTIKPDGTTEFNLYYRRNSYSVTYMDSDGNTIGAPETYLYGATVDVDFTITPTRLAYDFDGWSAGGGNVYKSTGTTSFTMGAAAVQLVPQWKSHPYLVKLHYNGGTYNGESAYSIILDVDCQESDDNCFDPTEIVPTKTHYTFDGWYVDGRLTQVYTGGDIDLSNPDNNPEDFHDWHLYAKWAQPANTPEGFVYVYGATVTDTITGSVLFNGTENTIQDLYVCDHEVTQAEYETYCMYGGGNSNTPSDWEGSKGENFPAYYVNWYDAILYCNLRSAAEGFDSVYIIDSSNNPENWRGISSENGKYHGPDANESFKYLWDEVTVDTAANGYRLPTELEWEYIARGGNGGIPAEQYVYSGSDDLKDVGWYSGNSENKIHEVKTITPNTLGIYDMSGNVSEWCFDVLSGTYRCLRGGNFCNNIEGEYDFCKVSYSGGSNEPHVWIYGGGFRVVRTVNP